MKNWRPIVSFVIFSLVLIVLIRSFLITTYVIEGQSMEPSYHSGDRVIVNLMEDLFFKPESGDVIMFRLNEHDTFVKRIVATPGDYVAVHHKQLFVNGEQATKKSADYRSLLKIEEMKKQIVPEKCYIVIGDHLSESMDSRAFGCVDEASILGRVIMIYWHATTK